MSASTGFTFADFTFVDKTGFSKTLFFVFSMIYSAIDFLDIEARERSPLAPAAEAGAAEDRLRVAKKNTENVIFRVGIAVLP